MTNQEPELPSSHSEHRCTHTHTHTPWEMNISYWTVIRTLHVTPCKGKNLVREVVKLRPQNASPKTFGQSWNLATALRRSLMHSPFLHGQPPPGEVTPSQLGPQTSTCSSVPSSQLLTPEHAHEAGMQSPSVKQYSVMS